MATEPSPGPGPAVVIDGEALRQVVQRLVDHIRDRFLVPATAQLDGHVHHHARTRARVGHKAYAAGHVYGLEEAVAWLEALELGLAQRLEANAVAREADAARRTGRVAQARQWIDVVECHDHPPLAPYAAPGGVPLTLLGTGRRLMLDLLDELEPAGPSTRTEGIG